MADHPSQNFGPLPDTLTFGPFGPDGDIIVHIENLVLGCPPFVQNIGVPFVCSGPGYGFVTLLDGGSFTLTPTSGSGYPCYRDEDGIVHVDAIPSGEGTFCVWVGDAETALGTVDYAGGINLAAHDLSQLNPSGPPISFVTFDGDLSSPSPFVIDLPSVLGVFVDFNTTIVAIDISQCVNATEISLLGNNLLTTVIPPTVFADGVLFQCGPSMAATSVDAVFNACDPTRIGTVSTSGDEPTGASAVNRSACIASGWTLYSNGVLLT